MALTVNRTLTLRNTRGMTKHTFTIKTSDTIFQHALVVIDISANTALAAANTTTTLFAGLAMANSTQTFPVTGDGTKTVDVYTNLEVSGAILKTAITKGDILSAAYCFDDGDFTHENTLGPECGTIVEFTAANNGAIFLGRKALGAAS